ncbi:MAG TPA: primosomal protein N' [Candidatus Saccharimonadales bacterium]|nr:primosomal protein N' [Candidatus Saccharimonadales bacterium]
MHYVEVLVGDATYHGGEALTYSAETPLPAGQIVVVPLRNKRVLGVVAGPGTKPARFAAKPVAEVPPLPALPAQLLALLAWMQGYYPAPLGIITQLLLPKALPKKPEALATLPPLSPPALPPFTQDQEQALQAIREPGLHILHGETGTGKTRVYIELAQRALQSGKSAIILTPEIGLTSQLARDFGQVFGQRVVVAHSGLTDAQRARAWQKILERQEPIVVIGARSALFSPLKNLGLVVVDESHETAYKQDQAPHYHTNIVAAKLAGLHRAVLVLGSATPLVADYAVAIAKKRPVVRMSQTAAGLVGAQKVVTVVDLRDRANFSRSPYLSGQLLAAIKSRLQNGEQTLLFLNRRGTARVVFCEKCGWQALCPHCDLPLVYHGDEHLMRCHSCEYKAPSPISCPECHNASVVFRSIGTKAVAEEAARLFPEARVQRFDTDNKKNERIEQHYDAVRAGGVDIIVGTQTLAKGLDLPRLGLVGVIIADTSLYFPDFSAQERTYQLLSQVLGRVGRGHRDSEAVIQTYAPDSSLLRAVIEKDWDAFYSREIAERKQFLFPPYCYALKLAVSRASSASAQRAAENFVRQLHGNVGGIAVEGPTPSFHEKVQNKFVWQVIVKAKVRARLLDVVAQLPSGWAYDIDPMNLL